METNNPQDHPEQNLLPVMLSLFVLAGLLIFLVLVSGGFFFYVILGAFIIAGVGMLHWVSWGQSMMDKTAGEREEFELQEEADKDPW